MDAELRNNLVEKLKGREPLPLLSLKDFFMGNDDIASIGCNLTNHPASMWVYEMLQQLQPDEVPEGDIDNCV
jgi:hypothetical protein